MALDTRVVLISCIFLDLIVLCVCQSVPIKVCGSGAPGYDVFNLTSRIWSFKGNLQNCLPVNDTVPATCTFYMGLCTNLNISSICTDSSVCQASKSNSTFYKLAEYSSDPFNIYIVPPGFTTKFGPGETINATGTGGKTCTLQTQFNFECNLRNTWPLEADSNLVPYDPSITYNPETCLYNITFEYAGACLEISPSTPITQLSGGTVLIIICVVTLTVYFTFGAMINIAKGNHGKDILPNSDFWLMLPVYVADGILFTLRCGKVSTVEYENIE